ncbi:MAG: hypothetical protein IKK82_00270, partial [Kiritimatiellae bacterium]|nr:hypothetical protein [Kiritimatiellia bacterium]
KERAFCSRAKIVRVPAEKDETDTQLALNIALENGAEVRSGLRGRSARFARCGQKGAADSTRVGG